MTKLHLSEAAKTTSLPIEGQDLQYFIETRLNTLLSPTLLIIRDDSDQHIGHAGAKGGAKHFSLTIVADIFANKTLVARHRLIYEALADAMQKQIHALVINAHTPEEYEKVFN